MAVTTVTTYASAVKDIWQDELLARAQRKTLVDKFANVKNIAAGAGDSITINKILRPALKTTSTSLNTLRTPSDAVALSSNKLTVTPYLMDSSFGFGEDVAFESFIKDSDNMDAIAEQMALSLDRYYMLNILGAECMRHRIDLDTTYVKQITMGASATASVIHSASLSEADNFWNGSFFTVTNPASPNYDLTRQMSADFATATDSGTTTVAFPQALTTASKGRITVGTGVVATDILTVSAIADVAALLEIGDAQPYQGNTFKALIHSYNLRDLLKDSVWLARAEYSRPAELENYKAYSFFGFDIMVNGNIRRETVAGALSDTGVVFVPVFFGKNSYSVMPWGHGVAPYGTKFYVVDKPDSQNLTNSQNFVSWKSHHGGAVTRATNVVGLMCGATDLLFDNGL